MGYIYLRTNKINGKHYVGQTDNIKRRNNAWNCLKTEYGGYAINNARKKYGVDGFSFEILKECPNEEMNYWEMYYVKQYNSKKPNGYNSTDGGDSIFEMTDETRKKIGDAMRGRKFSEETKAKMSAARRGRKRPDVAAALRGIKRSEETKAKMSAAQKNHPNMSKPIQALDKVTGEVVFTFPSAKEAERQGFDSGNISKCCRGKWKFYKGFIWRYAV